MYPQPGKEKYMKDKKEQGSSKVNQIRNTKVKDSGAKLIFDNHILF